MKSMVKPRERKAWQPDSHLREFWRTNLGNDYGVASKQYFLAPFLKSLDEKGVLGRNLLDVGAGSFRAYSKETGRARSAIYLPFKGKKILRLDIAFDRQRTIGDMMELPANVEHAENLDFSVLRKIAAAGKFFGVPRHSRAPPIDTILLSDILNYVDYKLVISSLSHYLKPGGRMVVYNNPGGGYSGWFSEKFGLKNNHDLLDFLKKSGFEIEYLHDIPEEMRLIGTLLLPQGSSRAGKIQLPPAWPQQPRHVSPTANILLVAKKNA